MVEKSPHIVILYNTGESEENSPLCICYLNIYIYMYIQSINSSVLVNSLKIPKTNTDNITD